MNLYVQANSAFIPLADNSVNLTLGSCPFLGQRLYGTPLVVWGGDPNCEHQWNEVSVDKISLRHGKGKSTLNTPYERVVETNTSSESYTCGICGAWMGELGRESSPQNFVDNMVTIGKEIFRVTAPDGLFILNVGDSYAGSGGQGPQSATPNGTYANNGTQPKHYSGYKDKDLIGVPWMVAFALRDSGWYLRSAPPWIKMNGLPNWGKDRPSLSNEYWFIFSKVKDGYFWDHDAVRAQTGRLVRTSDFYNASLDVLIADVEDYLLELKTARNNGMVLSPDGEVVGMKFNAGVFMGDHSATYNPKMIVPFIQAGTSEMGCCPICRRQWVRVIQKEEDLEWKRRCGSDKEGTYKGRARKSYRKSGAQDASVSKRHILNSLAKRTTVEWIPTCEHKEKPVPCVVLDPFAGAGTTLGVAQSLGRQGIGIDLKFENCELAREWNK